MDKLSDTSHSLPYRRKYECRDLSELSNWDLWFSDAVAWTYLGMVLVMTLVYNTDGKTEGRLHFFPLSYCCVLHFQKGI